MGYARVPKPSMNTVMTVANKAIDPLLINNFMNLYTIIGRNMRATMKDNVEANITLLSPVIYMNEVT